MKGPGSPKMSQVSQGNRWGFSSWYSMCKEEEEELEKVKLAEVSRHISCVQRQ